MRSIHQHPLFKVWQEVAVQKKWHITLDVFFFLFSIYSDQAILMWLSVISAAFPFAFAYWRFRHVLQYQKFVESYALGHWSSMQKLSKKLENIKHLPKELQFDVDLRMACIKAREGHLIKAMQMVAPWEKFFKELPGFFEMRVASLYTCAGEKQLFLEQLSKAYDLSPNDSNRKLDLALAQARLGYLEEASLSLENLNTHKLPAHAKAFLNWTHGLIASKNQPEAALKFMNAAVSDLLEMAHQPVSWISLAFCVADHALILKQLGHADQARIELQRVYSILKVHADAELIQKLKDQDLIQIN